MGVMKYLGVPLFSYLTMSVKETMRVLYGSFVQVLMPSKSVIFVGHVEELFENACAIDL